ncbi:MAG: SAM-dependent methyltransferase [Chloroflexi bacterium]|nr:SAM-dependent methyltransferase [Chloroflexota bacterium]
MASWQLEQMVKDRIRECGAVTFAQFMETALYHQPGGYYTSGAERIGAGGDFYTSPLAHPAFGALIAVQLEQMWEKMGSPQTFYVVELGSGKGALARDIQGYSQRLSPGFHRAMRYITLERDRSRLSGSVDGLVSKGLPLRHVQGCILSNELLDAMPVHRLVRRGGRLREIYVGLREGDLVEEIRQPSDPRLEERLEGFGVSLAEGQEAEVNLLLEDWLGDVSRALDRGYLITIDYGYPARELYSEARPLGTLMCHFMHTTNRRPLSRIGQQDITAHVDFTTLMEEGKGLGLRALGLVSQARFLGNLGADSFIRRLGALGLPSGEYHSNLLGMRNLIDPEGLGKFRVLIQGKGDVSEGLYGLRQGSTSRQGALADRSGLPVPLLGQHHIDLLRGRYPHLAWSPENLA